MTSRGEYRARRRSGWQRVYAKLPKVEEIRDDEFFVDEATAQYLYDKHLVLRRMCRSGRIIAPRWAEGMLYAGSKGEVLDAGWAHVIGDVEAQRAITTIISLMGTNEHEPREALLASELGENVRRIREAVLSFLAARWPDAVDVRLRSFHALGG